MAASTATAVRSRIGHSACSCGTYGRRTWNTTPKNGMNSSLPEEEARGGEGNAGGAWPLRLRALYGPPAHRLAGWCAHRRVGGAEYRALRARAAAQSPQ